MNRGYKILFILFFLVLEVFAYINAYVIDLKGATVDSDRFREKASEWAVFGDLQFATDSAFFIQYLGVLNKIFGDNEFLLTQIGLVAMVAAGVYFYKLLKIFHIRHCWFFLLLFFLWPSSLPRVTTTMREPYLIFIIMVASYHLLSYVHQGIKNDLYKTIFWAAIGALFHKAFAVLFLGILAYVFVIRTKNFSGHDFIVRLAIVFGAGALIWRYSGTLLDVKGLNAASSLVTGDTEYIRRIVEYKSNREFRTTYKATMEFTSIWAFIKSAPLALLYYLFAPFPWTVRSPLDVYGAFEGLFRIFGVLALFRIPRDELKFALPVALVVAMLIFIWAAGTANYGTASRHHITTNWFFFLVIGVWWFREKAYI